MEEEIKNYFQPYLGAFLICSWDWFCSLCLYRFSGESDVQSAIFNWKANLFFFLNTKLDEYYLFIVNLYSVIWLVIIQCIFHRFSTDFSKYIHRYGESDNLYLEIM
jgi:hypothetical protein